MLRFSFRQQVFAGFAVSVILVLIVGFLSYKSISQLEDDSTLVEHTQKILNTSTSLLQLMLDAETGMRGFAATNKPALLEPYNAALPRIKSNIEQLRNLIADNPVQVRRVDSLAVLTNNQLNILKTAIEVRQVQGLDYMVQNNMFFNGKYNMDEIRAVISHLRNTEAGLLAVRKANTKATSSRVIYTIAVGFIVFLIIISRGLLSNKIKLKEK
jgi:CHASE3 domain sensor protein